MILCNDLLVILTRRREKRYYCEYLHHCFMIHQIYAHGLQRKHQNPFYCSTRKLNYSFICVKKKPNNILEIKKKKL